MDETLKPCLCGGRPIKVRTVISPELFIECDNCHARGFADNDLAVIEKWNDQQSQDGECAQRD